MANEDKRLSILLVIDSLGPGGAQRQLVSLANGLAQRGHQIALFTYYPSADHFKRELERKSIEILEIQKGFRIDLRPAFALRKVIYSRRFDAVVSFLNTPNIYTVLATFGNHRTRVVVSERAGLPDGRLPVRVWLRYQFYRFADAVTVNSHHQRDRMLQEFPWIHDKLVTIWNGVDLSRFIPHPRSKVNRTNSKHIIAVATLAAGKNATNLIRALAIINADDVSVRMDWAGEVEKTKYTGNEFERCQRLIHEFGLTSDWRWLGVCENMEQIYRKYDALVHPSFREGLPNVICEALAAGLPVVASNVCDHPLLIEDGVNGWLFDPGDPRSIADALQKLVQQSDNEYLAMSHEARRIAMNRLSMDKMIDAYERLLCESCS